MPDDRNAFRPTVFPALRYADAAAAIEWLATAFGFEKGLVVSDEDGVIAHAELWIGSGAVMLGQAREEHHGATAEQQSIYVAVDDIDAHHARAKAAGAQIVSDPFDTDYGSREYAVRDPDGYRWDFGTYLPESK